MTRLLSLFLISIVVLSCSTTNNATDSAKENLTGNVKMLTHKTYNVQNEDDKIIKTNMIDEISKIEYNTNGKVTKKFSHKINGTIVQNTLLYEYNGNGNLIIEKIIDEEGIQIHLSKHVLNKSGQSIEINHYDKNNILVAKNTIEYFGKNMESKSFSPELNMYVGKTVFMHDKNGNKTHVLIYDPNDNLVSDENFIYNSKDQLIEKFTTGSYPSTKEIFEYDNMGNISSTSNYKSDGSIIGKITFKYEYDKNNNWNKKITFINSIPESITERLVEYY